MDGQGSASTRAWQLALRAPLHVGERGIGVEETLDYLPSDSLFSALAVAWQRSAPHRTALAELEQAFVGTPPLRLTSAFPYIGNLLLFPKPHLAAPRPVEGQEAVKESGKEYKRVRWVSQQVFTELLQGPEQAKLDELWADKVLLQGGAVWVTRDEAKALGAGQPDGEFWKSDRVPKVTVDRLTNASQIFHVGRVHFAPGCGLWCMAQGEAAWLDRVEAGLNLLADDGLGGQRSRGNGQFECKKIEPPPSLPQLESAYGVLLSRFAPSVAEMALLRSVHAAYGLALVGGFSGTAGDPPFVRRQVRLLVEGSVIGTEEGTASAASGRLVDVTPSAPEVTARLDHPIYRYGVAYTVPIRVPAARKEGA
jgi:CRISPR-associated protein Csm4